MATVSRHSSARGLPSNQWYVIERRLCARGNPAFQSSKITFQIQADANRPGLGVNLTGQVLLKIQESNDGIVWFDRYNHLVALVPGGQLTIDFWHLRSYVRFLGYARNGDAFVHYTIEPEEIQSLPNYVPDENELTCRSFCEVDCETGTESTGHVLY